MQNSINTKTNLSEQEEEVCVDIFKNITRLRHLLHQMASEIAAQSGLHIAEMNVIDILGKYGPVSMGRLSRETFISPSNTTSTVKKLEDVALVTRRRSTKSDREVTVELTRSGKALFRKCYPQILGRAQALLSDRLTGAESRKLATILNKLVT